MRKFDRDVFFSAKKQKNNNKNFIAAIFINFNNKCKILLILK